MRTNVYVYANRLCLDKLEKRAFRLPVQCHSQALPYEITPRKQDSDRPMHIPQDEVNTDTGSFRDSLYERNERFQEVSSPKV